MQWGDVGPVVFTELCFPLINGQHVLRIRFTRIQCLVDGGIGSGGEAIQVIDINLREQAPWRITPHIAITLFFLFGEVYADYVLIDCTIVVQIISLTFNTICE